LRGAQQPSAPHLAQKHLNSLLRESTANGIAIPFVYILVSEFLQIR
jgi:hypothetical protein